MIIGDGLKGTDDVAVRVIGGEYVKEAKIGRAVMDADIFVKPIPLQGARVHRLRRRAEEYRHGLRQPGGQDGAARRRQAGGAHERCRKCRACARSCGQDAIAFDGNEGTARIDHDRCVGCGRCIGACNFDAIFNPNDSTNVELCCKMAEYAKAVVDGRPQFHISLVIDVSPLCDCYSGNDPPILPDVGMFASFDAVALDQACADACQRQAVIPRSVLDEHMHAQGFCDHHDHFKNTEPNSEWEACLVSRREDRHGDAAV